MKPIRLRAAPDFDVDEWAALYESDPAAFEARRQSLIVIELARSGSSNIGPAARLVRALAAADQPHLPAVRLTLAARAINESSRTMNQAFVSLTDQLRRIASGRNRAIGKG